MSNLFLKIKKISARFLTKTGRKKILGKNYHNTLLNLMVFHQLMEKFWHFEAYCKNMTQKIPFSLQEKSENWNLLITHRKKFSAVESLEYDRSSTCRSFYAKIGWIRPIGAEKVRFKEMKRRGMSRMRKKTKSFCCVLVRKGSASLRSPKKKSCSKSVALFVQNVD